MIKNQQLVRTICIEPKFLNSDIYTHLFGKAKDDWEGKCTKDDGIITKVYSIEKIIDNYISPATSGLIFELILNVETMKPRIGDVFSQKVVQIIPQGYFTTNAIIVIFVPSSESKSNIAENDIFEVVITSIKYERNTFQYIGKFK